MLRDWGRGGGAARVAWRMCHERQGGPPSSYPRTPHFLPLPPPPHHALFSPAMPRATTKSVLELNFRVAEEESKAFEGHLRPKLGDVMSLTGVDSVDVYKQESARPKPTVVFVLGGPGAGKGTQCTRITEEFG